MFISIVAKFSLSDGPLTKFIDDKRNKNNTTTFQYFVMYWLVICLKFQINIKHMFYES